MIVDNQAYFLYDALNRHTAFYCCYGNSTSSKNVVTHFISRVDLFSSLIPTYFISDCHKDRVVTLRTVQSLGI